MGEHLPGKFQVDPIAYGQAGQLQRLRGVDDQYPVNPAILRKILRQQRDGEHAITGPLVVHTLTQPVAHAWMDDCLQRPPRGRVGKHALAHGRAVEATGGVQHTDTERVDHRLQPVAARLDHLARSHIGVMHGNAKRLEAARHCTLASGDAAGQRHRHCRCGHCRPLSRR